MRIDQDLSQWLEPLLYKLTPEKRLHLMRQVMRLARERNQQRIRQQIAPDGSRFAPRALSLRKTGLIKKRAMFSKIRLNKFLLQSTTSNEAAIFWAGRTGRIAEMHHFGKSETINGQKYNYPARHLLGINDDDEHAIMDLIIDYLQT